MSARVLVIDDGAHRIGQPGARIHDQQRPVGILRATPGGGHHGAVQPPARGEDAGRVHQDDLRALVHDDRADAEPRGLRLR